MPLTTRLRPARSADRAARIVSPEAAWQVGHILAGMPPPPNAARQRLAYKTGTSYGHRDTWAVGFDARHVVTVWMGRPDGTPVPGAFGADMAAPVLFEAFARLKPALDPLPPPPPGTLVLSNAALPLPLREFRSRAAVFAARRRAGAGLPARRCAGRDRGRAAGGEDRGRHAAVHAAGQRRAGGGRRPVAHAGTAARAGPRHAVGDRRGGPVGAGGGGAALKGELRRGVG